MGFPSNSITIKRMEKKVAVIDLKSFYASVECSVRHLDPFTTPLVCCDPNRGPNSVVMSATPFLKATYGIPNVCRKRDLPSLPNMIFATPRMELYLTISSKIVSLFLDYVAEEDLHVYSVDESFLNLGPYLSMYGKDAQEIVKDIQAEIMKRFGLTATAGIGPNPFLAKIALDVEGKKKPPYIAEWSMDDVPTKLWNVDPIDKIWGISNGTKSHLARIGIRTLKELAHADESLLVKEFGIMGHQLHDLSNGRDESNIQEKYIPKETSFSYGQTLIHPYSKSEALILMREHVDELTYRLRRNGCKTKLISLFVEYQGGGAFSKQRVLPVSTDDTDILFKEVKDLYMNGVLNVPLVGLSLNFGKLNQSNDVQLFLFEDNEALLERSDLSRCIDAVNETYGKNTVLRATSLLKESTVIQRHMQIGGHKR